MNIDISKIISDKIKDMEGNKVVETVIEETIENSIVAAVKSALSGYELKRTLEKKMEKEVSQVVSNIGFTGYNGFIAEKVKEITQGALREDIVETITKKFNEILIMKKDKIKLSEICDAYREYICENVDESEKYELQDFYTSIKEDEKYHWIDVRFAKAEKGYSYDNNDIRFSLHRRSNNNDVWYIGTLNIDGYDICKTLDFTNVRY
ncbi:hypothetical protein CLFE_013220 [Clostridium felsineum DSM 794]|nr:hypothetical protein CLFE_013220 [Clostridium felsineum DSM 794]